MSANATSPYKKHIKSFQPFWIVSLVSLLLMLWHDLDHLRVSLDREYRIVPEQLLTIIIAYAPISAMLYAVYKRSQHIVMVYLFSGGALSTGFVVLHIVGTSAISSVFDPFLGEWRVPFFCLQPDSFSSSNLIVNIIWSLAVVIWSVKMLVTRIRG